MHMANCLMMMLLVLLASGCYTEDYNVVIKNIGGHTIRDAAVVYGEFRSIGGVIIAGSKKGHGHPEYSIPNVATVEWRTDDGVLHRQDVEVRKILPRRFRGDIQFEIDDSNNVSIRVIPQ